MNKLKTIKLAAEDFSKTFGLTFFDNITEEYSDFEFGEIPINSELKTEIMEWYNSYYKFTGMTITELSNYSEKIKELDNAGIEIVKSISKELKGKLNCNLTYYSRGKDKLIFETTTE